MRRIAFAPKPKWPSRSGINSMIDLSGKVVIITGASRGIGAATALVFARAGARGIVINYKRDREAAAQVAAECRQSGAEVLIHRADVSRLGAVEKLVRATV